MVEEGGFTAAQTSLNLSQSSLSEYLKSLEVRLGLTLCQRGPKGFQLYEDGRKVYVAAREMFTALEIFKNQVTDINKGVVGQINIAIQDGIVGNPHSRLPEALNLFEQAYPGVRVKLEVMLGYQVLGRVADNMLPLGVCLLQASFEPVTSISLFDEAIHLYCSDKHALFKEDAETLTDDQVRAYRYCSRGHLEWTHPEWANEGSYASDIGLGAEAQLALVLSGRTLGYIPDHIAKPYLQAGFLKRMSAGAEPTRSPVVLIKSPGASKFRLANKLSDFIVKVHQI